MGGISKRREKIKGISEFLNPNAEEMLCWVLMVWELFIRARRWQVALGCALDNAMAAADIMHNNYTIIIIIIIIRAKPTSGKPFGEQKRWPEMAHLDQ